MTNNSQPQYYTTDYIAADLGVVPRTVQKLLKRGELKGHKLGRDWVVLSTDYENFKKGYSVTSKE